MMKVRPYQQQIASGTHLSPHAEREALAQRTLLWGATSKLTTGLCFLVRGYECHTGGTAKTLPFIGHRFS